MTTLNTITKVLAILIPLILLFSISKLTKIRDYDRIRKRNYRRLSFILSVGLLLSNIWIWIVIREEIHLSKLENKKLSELNESILKENDILRTDGNELHLNQKKLTDKNLSISEKNTELSSVISELKSKLNQKENKISNLENQVKSLEISAITGEN